MIEDAKAQLEAGMCKAGTKFFIIGKSFIKEYYIKIGIFKEAKLLTTISSIYKNEEKLGFAMPDIEGLEPGDHELIIEISFNGMQYSKCGQKIKFKCNFIT